MKYKDHSAKLLYIYTFAVLHCTRNPLVCCCTITILHCCDASQGAESELAVLGAKMKVAGWTKRLIGLRKTFFHREHQTSERCVASINKRLVNVHSLCFNWSSRRGWFCWGKPTRNIKRLKMSSQHVSKHVSSSIYESLLKDRPLSFHWSSGRGWSRKSWAQCAR